MTLTDTTRRKIVIMGGGIAGVTAMNHIFEVLRHPNVTLIEPSGQHEYPPLWPLLAVGLVEPGETRRPMSEFFPDGARWFRGEAAKIEHNDRIVVTEDKHQIDYEYLIACPPLVPGYGKIKGIDDAREAGQFCDVSSHDDALAARDLLDQFSGGTILFASPHGARNDGSVLRLAFLVDDLLRRKELRSKAKLVVLTAADKPTDLDAHNGALEAIAKRKDIELRLGVSPTKIDAEAKQAQFGAVNEKGKVEKDGELIDYDLLHIAPLYEPPKAIVKNRKITVSRGDEKGFLQVDPATLQQQDYPTIFGAGDSLSLPLLQSAAAHQEQGRIAGLNCVAALQGRGPGMFERYDGYSALPFTTSKGKVYLAESNYQQQPPKSFWRPEGEHLFNWWSLRHVSPRLYWKSAARSVA